MAYRVFGNCTNDDNAVVDDLQETFVQAIKYLLYNINYSNNNLMNMTCLIKINFRDLKFLQERQKRKCEKLEQDCREKESLYLAQIQNRQDHNKVHN